MPDFKNTIISEETGSIIYLDTLMTYPLYLDGTPDLDGGVHWNDTTEEYRAEISEEHKALIEEAKGGQDA